MFERYFGSGLSSLFDRDLDKIFQQMKKGCEIKGEKSEYKPSSRWRWNGISSFIGNTTEYYLIDAEKKYGSHSYTVWYHERGHQWAVNVHDAWKIKAFDCLKDAIEYAENYFDALNKYMPDSKWINSPTKDLYHNYYWGEYNVYNNFLVDNYHVLDEEKVLRMPFDTLKEAIEWCENDHKEKQEKENKYIPDSKWHRVVGSRIGSRIWWEYIWQDYHVFKALGKDNKWGTGHGVWCKSLKEAIEWCENDYKEKQMKAEAAKEQMEVKTTDKKIIWEFKDRWCGWNCVLVSGEYGIFRANGEYQLRKEEKEKNYNIKIYGDSTLYNVIRYAEKLIRNPKPKEPEYFDFATALKLMEEEKKVKRPEHGWPAYLRKGTFFFGSGGDIDREMRLNHQDLKAMNWYEVK